MHFTRGDAAILVDCGLFQGSRSLEILNTGEFSFDPRKIDAVILTHAHIDHSGLVPKLVANGFKGKIWCTQPTADLLEYMLADSGRIHEADAQRHNRRRDRAGDEPFDPIYTEEDAIKTWRQCQSVEEETWFEPAPGFRARLWNAGHILGSTSVELEGGGARIMCSGDLGPDNKAFYLDPAGPSGFDYVVCESTYGDRAREKITLEQRRKLLEAEVRRAIVRGGNLIIPSFALERTQELLLDLANLSRSGALSSVPIFVDSPLANRVTSVFARYAEELEDTGRENIFSDPAIHFVDDVAQSIRLNSVSGAIILAASGMCEGGRIRHHLKNNLHRRDSTILFVGFQAQGSLGRVILDGADTVRISGSDIRVRAQIRQIDSYSAHADQSELLDWIEERQPISGSLFLTHGESAAIEELRRLLQQRRPELSIRVPEIGETYALAPAKPAKRTATGPAELQQAIGQDWQNDYARFTTSLKKELGKIRSEQQRQDAIEAMRRVLDSYKDTKQERRKARKR